MGRKPDDGEGGEGGRTLRVVAEVVEGPVQADDLRRRIAGTGDGAVLLFLGVVRDHHREREVTALAYEAYGAMAREVMEQIARETAERYGLSGIAIRHGTGTLRPGEASLAVAVASPHRASAFEASRRAVEELKHRLPVWKHERYVDGTGRWLEGVVPGAKPGTGPGDTPERGDGTMRGGREERGR